MLALGQAHLLLAHALVEAHLVLSDLALDLDLGHLGLSGAVVGLALLQDLGLDHGLLGLGTFELSVCALGCGFAFGLGQLGCLHALLHLFRGEGLGAGLVAGHLLDDFFLVHQAAGVDDHAVGQHDAGFAHGHDLLELAVFQSLAARHRGHDHVVLAQRQVVLDLFVGRLFRLFAGLWLWVGLVDGEGLRLAGGFVVRDRHQALFGVELLHQVQHVAGQDEVSACQVVQRLHEVRAAGLTLLLDRLGGYVRAVHALHAVTDARDRLEGLLGLVAHAVQALGHLVRLDLLDVLVRVAVDLDHEAGLCAPGLQLGHGHIDQCAGLDLVA